ncbi:glutaredoxin 3 [Pseudomonas sp.]|uniref:glutaredoxin 3 n=1 Tax=Pseudomonas sp. TaxID=306 RepID=UPI003D0AF6AB
MSEVTLYTTSTCPYCRNAKALLASKGVEPREINVESSPELIREMMARSGRRTVPQVFIGERHVGGFDDLAALDRAGELTPLLTH